MKSKASCSRVVLLLLVVCPGEKEAMLKASSALLGCSTH